jgi:hypothetical protein
MCSPRWSGTASGSTSASSPRRPRLARELELIQQEIWKLAGEEFNINSTPQLRTILFDKLGLPCCARRRRAVHGRERARGAGGAGARAAAAAHGVPADRQAEGHVRRCAAAAGEPAHAADPHELQPDGRGDRPAVVERPEPAEHPDPHGAGRRDPQGLHPGRRLRLRHADYSQIELRILAHSPATRRSSRRSAAAPTSTGRRPPSCSASSRGGCDGEMRAAAKTVNFATIYGIGPFALSHQLGTRCRRRRSSSRTTSSASPTCAATSTSRSRRRATLRLRRDDLRPPPLHPRDQQPQLQHPAVRRARGDQRAGAGQCRRHHQARHDRDPPRAGRRGRARACCCRCTTSSCSRRRRGEM